MRMNRPAFKTCPVCANHSGFRLQKGKVDYYQCSNCQTLFSEPLENADMVGGGNEEQRNVEQNHLRIERINNLFRRNPADIHVLDFGCGNFRLGNDLIAAGYNCDGYDCYNPLYDKLPTKDKYDVCTAIEVIEHTSFPFAEIDVIKRSLKKGGVVMIESSFINVAEQEHIELEDFFYIEPSVGHSTIFSHHGLDLLLALRGFKPFTHWNRHVRGFIKL